MNNILKYPGSKWKIAQWIISHFPEGYEHLAYLEAFFGSGAVFFTKERSRVETINDLNDDVVNLFRIVRDYPEELAQAIYFTPWARTEYEQSYDRSECDELEKARRFLVRMWQAIGAKSCNRTGWRKDIANTNGNKTRFHATLPDNILLACERLKHTRGNRVVQIENKDALELIRYHNTVDTLIYADPPYLKSVRNGKLYGHELNDDDHRRLLVALQEHKGPVVLSGYASTMYDDVLHGWYKYETQTLAESSRHRTEVIWCNYPAERQMKLRL